MRVARPAGRPAVRERQRRDQQRRQPAVVVRDAAATLPAAAERDQLVRAAAQPDCAAAGRALLQRLHSALLVALAAQPRGAPVLGAWRLALHPAAGGGAALAGASRLPAGARRRAPAQLAPPLGRLARPRHPQQPPFPPAPSASAAAAAAPVVGAAARVAAAAVDADAVAGASVLVGVSPFDAADRRRTTGRSAVAGHLGAASADLVRLQSLGADTADVLDAERVVGPRSLVDRLQCYQRLEHRRRGCAQQLRPAAALQ